MDDGVWAKLIGVMFALNSLYWNYLRTFSPENNGLKNMGERVQNMNLDKIVKCKTSCEYRVTV
jgi:hypothetical protein